MKIVLICSGNASRSPFAEVVLRRLLDEAGMAEVEVTSAGTLDLDGSPRDEGMIREAARWGYELGGKTVHLTEILLRDADWVLTMSKHHRDAVTQVMPYDHWDRIRLFKEYCTGESTDIPDPTFQTEAVYRRTAEQIVRCCEALVQNLKANPSTV